jgi:plastocyanin
MKAMNGGTSVKRALVLMAVALLPASLVAVQAGAATKSHAKAKVSIVKITALKSGLKYNTKLVRAKAGKVKIVFVNQSSLPHNVRIEQGENEFGGTKTITKGKTTATLTLKRGKYSFYCSVPGHEDAGMTGTLVVR